MNKKHFFSTRKLCPMAIVVCAALFFGSCADHYDDDASWSSPVSNAASLSSPESITIETNSDGSQMTISWPVVYGAGGYELKVLDANDETNVIVADTIDGCSKTMDREEDMNYKIVVRTLANAKLNNPEATTAKDTLYSTFTATYAEIPAGDLYEYFQNNPIPDDQTGELNFDLVSKGQYTLSKPLNFNYHKVVIRTADKNNHATITLGEDANFIISNDFTLKYVDVDASANTKPLIEAYNYGDAAPDDILQKPGNYYLLEFVRLLNSEIKGVVGSLYYDNNKPYGVVNFLIKNTLIEMTTTTDRIKNESWISCQGGGVKDFAMNNSTVYQTGTGNSKYFLRYNNSIRVDRLGWTTSDHTTITYTNNTFYKVATGNWSNYSGIANYTTYDIKNNIWHSCGDGAIARRIMGNGRLGSGASAVWADNTYWNAEGQVDQGTYDTGNVLTTDPAFEDADNGDFTPTGAEQVAKKTGDQRWYDSAE